MSKHWHAKGNGWAGRQDGQRRPGKRGRARRRSSGFDQVRLVLLGAIALGLAYVFLPSAELALPGGGTQVKDPWAITITDGDTFRYRGDKIRIADIDTPEIRGRCAYERRLAARATDRMEELLQAGPFEMQPIPGRDEDRYGRKLRVVVRDGHSLGDQLVAEGLARTWEGRRRPWCA